MGGGREDVIVVVKVMRVIANERMIQGEEYQNTTGRMHQGPQHTIN